MSYLPVECVSPTTPKPATTTTSSPTKCNCTDNGVQIQEGMSYLVQLGQTCLQQVTCLSGCGSVNRGEVSCRTPLTQPTTPPTTIKNTSCTCRLQDNSVIYSGTSKDVMLADGCLQMVFCPSNCELSRFEKRCPPAPSTQPRCNCISNGGVPFSEGTAYYAPYGGACTQKYYCLPGCEAIRRGEISCKTSTTTTPSPSVTHAPKTCDCVFDNVVIPETTFLRIPVSTNCTQKKFCVKGCSRIYDLSISCDTQPNVIPITTVATTTTVAIRPTACTCSWRGKRFTDLLPTTRCFWVRCVPHGSSCAPKSVFSCANPDSGMEPSSTVWMDDPKDFKSWGTWEVDHANGVHRRHRVTETKAPNIVPAKQVRQCDHWFRCMPDPYCIQKYNICRRTRK